MYSWKSGGRLPIGMLSCYHPQTKFGQGNIFSSGCQEFCSWGGLPQCMLGYDTPQKQTPQKQTPPRSRPPPWKQSPRKQTPPEAEPLEADTPLRSAYWEIRSTSGRYAFYWNAILLKMYLYWYNLLHHWNHENDSLYDSHCRS